MTGRPATTEVAAWTLRMGIGVSVRRDSKDNTVNTGCSLVQTNHASKVAHAKRGIMAVVTHASVHQDTLDLTVRRKWTNVPHCNAPMVDTAWSTVTSEYAAVAQVSRDHAARSTSTSAPQTPAQTAPPA